MYLLSFFSKIDHSFKL